MSDENTARHAECTVEFDGVDITSSIKPYLLSLTFTDNEEDASDDLQIKLQDREGVWMTDWLQKMLDGDVSAASSDGYKVGDVVQFLGGPHYKASTDKKANGTQRLARPRSHHQAGRAAPVPCYSHGRNVPGLWLGRCQRDLR